MIMCTQKAHGLAVNLYICQIEGKVSVTWCANLKWYEARVEVHVVFHVVKWPP